MAEREIDSFRRGTFSVTTHRIGTGEKPVVVGGVLELAITHDLRAVFRTAKLTLVDDSGIRELLPLTGNEVFTIRYRNQVKDNDPVEIDFESITTNEDILNTWTAGHRGLTLYLVEYPLFRTLMGKASEGFHDTTTSDIITALVRGIPGYETDIAETAKEHDQFVIPRTWTVAHTIRYLSQITAGGPYYLYPESYFDDGIGGYRNRIVYKGLPTILEGSPEYAMWVTADADLKTYTTGQASLNLVTDFKTQIGDKVFFLHDLTTSTHFYHNYERDIYGSEIMSYRDVLRDPDLPRIGERGLFQEGISDIMPNFQVVGEQAQFDERTETATHTRNVLKNTYRDNLLQQAVLRLTAIGHEDRNVGEKIGLVFPTTERDENTYIDETLSGEWVVTHIEHHLDFHRRYINYMIVERNSYLGSVDDQLPEVQ